MEFEIFRAYKMADIGLTYDEIQAIISRLRKAKFTFSLVEQAVASNRAPLFILQLAGKLGMFIPYSKRMGLACYDFFIENVDAYESVLEKKQILPNAPMPSQQDIFLSKHPKDILQTFEDEKILRFGFSFLTEYNVRDQMLEHFIESNYGVIGKFDIETNKRFDTSNDLPVFVFKSSNEKIAYSINDLLSNLNKEKRILMKNPQELFHPLSVLSLKKAIYEKLCNWQSTNPTESIKSNKLNLLLNYLEFISGNWETKRSRVGQITARYGSNV